MGQEVSTSHFLRQDFVEFADHLRQETELLQEWFQQAYLDPEEGFGGFELEAWLVDQEVNPNPINQLYLQEVQNPQVVPELARFNVEINADPQPLKGKALHQMHQALSQTWTHCCQTASRLDADLVMIGILPTLQQQDLHLGNMSPLQRYQALNEQVLSHCQAGMPLNIKGGDHLCVDHPDIMLESATTSFQVHLQVSPDRAARLYNASLLVSAALVGIASNSPFLFQQDLWQETRIPLFEQALGSIAPPQAGYLDRVTFGSGYVSQSLLECFLENLSYYPVLLPVIQTTDAFNLAHLRLHNGTIWRWNRPLIGFNAHHQPHLRIEQRVFPAGPTVTDMIANAALFYGLVYGLAALPQPPEERLSFELARANFYAAAERGLGAEVIWLDQHPYRLGDLLQQELLPLAYEGLTGLDLALEDIQYYLGIIAARLQTGQTGAVWQRAYVAKHGKDMQQLTRAYLHHQQSDQPVHTWNLD